MWTKIVEGAGGSDGRRTGAWWSDRASSAVASAILDVMRIAVMQDKAVVGDVDANLAIIDRRAGEAAARRADVLVTPELFVTGYAPKRLHAGDRPTRLPPLRFPSTLAILVPICESRPPSRISVTSAISVHFRLV